MQNKCRISSHTLQTKYHPKQCNNKQNNTIIFHNLPRICRRKWRKKSDRSTPYIYLQQFKTTNSSDQESTNSSTQLFVSFLVYVHSVFYPYPIHPWVLRLKHFEPYTKISASTVCYARQNFRSYSLRSSFHVYSLLRSSYGKAIKQSKDVIS